MYAQAKIRGYSLVETMVAIIIAAIGVAGLSTAVSHANRLGNSASQSTILTMAQRSALSQLRTAHSDRSTAPADFRFRSGELSTSTPASPLSRELQQLVDELSFSLSDVRSAVNCESNGAVTCEICFHWYDNAQSAAPPGGSETARGATDRSTCQIQIV